MSKIISTQDRAIALRWRQADNFMLKDCPNLTLVTADRPVAALTILDNIPDVTLDLTVTRVELYSKVIFTEKTMQTVMILQLHNQTVDIAELQEFTALYSLWLYNCTIVNVAQLPQDIESLYVKNCNFDTIYDVATHLWSMSIDQYSFRYFTGVDHIQSIELSNFDADFITDYLVSSQNVEVAVVRCNGLHVNGISDSVICLRFHSCRGLVINVSVENLSIYDCRNLKIQKSGAYDSMHIDYCDFVTFDTPFVAYLYIYQCDFLTTVNYNGNGEVTVHNCSAFTKFTGFGLKCVACDWYKPDAERLSKLVTCQAAVRRRRAMKKYAFSKVMCADLVKVVAEF